MVVWSVSCDVEVMHPWQQQPLLAVTRSHELPYLLVRRRLHSHALSLNEDPPSSSTPWTKLQMPGELLTLTRQPTNPDSSHRSCRWLYSPALAHPGPNSLAQWHYPPPITKPFVTSNGPDKYVGRFVPLLPQDPRSGCSGLELDERPVQRQGIAWISTTTLPPSRAGEQRLRLRALCLS
jgi:hypothetical protein